MDVKPHAGFGILSFVVAVLAVLCFVAAVIGSAFYLADGVVWPGYMATGAIVLNMSGIVFAVLGELEPETEKLFPHLSAGLHLILLVFNIVVIVQGYK